MAQQLGDVTGITITNLLWGVDMKKALAVILSIVLAAVPLSLCVSAEFNSGYISVADYIDFASADVSDAIQNVIDSNPNRTIYFPDGTYKLSKSIFTPADPRKSVDLQLSNFAVLKANSDFDGDAVVRLGGKDPYNTTRINGSNYSLNGGIIDGSNITNGVSIDSGRETRISNVSIKNTIIGIHVKYGANSGSSDSDIIDCNIIGTGKPDSVGILLEGYDNTITNVRLGNIFIGIWLKSSGNSLTNLHPLYTSDYTDYENSCGFYDEGGSNTYNYCYSDQFCIGFYVKRATNIYTDCFVYWYSSNGNREIAFKAEKSFDSRVSGVQIGFRGDTNNTLLEAHGLGKGSLDRISFNPKYCKGYFTYEWYMTDSFLYTLKCMYFAIQRFFQSAF